MGRASAIQHAFNAGEWSPLMYVRQDLDNYGKALATCLNAIPLVQGAWTRRPGTVFIHQARHHNKEARLLPFQYSATQTYQLEFGESYIRFYTSRGLLTQTAQNITAITKANPAVVTYSGADTYANGNRVRISGVAGMTQVNGREFVVTNVNVGANTFELYDSDGAAVNSTSYDTYTSGGTVAEAYEVTTAFTEAELPNIRIIQSADTLYILHPDHPPQTLVRVSATSWTLANLDIDDGPYDTLNATSTTLTPGAATGTGVSLTASAVTGINGGLGFQTTDVGRQIRLREGSTWGWVTITGWTSTTVVTVTVESTLTNTNAKVNWRMGIWSDTTGWPSCGTFYDDRLFLGGAATYPQRLDGSKTGAYTSFQPSAMDGTVAADNAVGFTLNADDVNVIRWMAATEKGMAVGTMGGEWLVRPSSLNEAVTPTNVAAKQVTREGSAAVAPVQPGQAVLFVQRAGRKLRELAYVFQEDGMRAPDMTRLAEHITNSGIEEMSYQRQPQSILWAKRTDGAMLGMTYERNEGVVAWHKHTLGGFSNAGGTAAALVESVCVTASPDGTRDELYIIAKRYINGGTKRYVEYLGKIWEDGDTQSAAVFADCSYTAAGAGSATIGGLWHLEGQTVGAYVDGKKHVNVTVSNGKVTLGLSSWTTATLGYYYNSDGKSMPLDGGTPDGSAQSKVKRQHKLGLWLKDTLGLKIGPDFTTMTELLFREHGDDHGEATPLFSGSIRERLEGEYSRDPRYCWRADGPFPATVLASMPQFNVSDDS